MRDLLKFAIFLSFLSTSYCDKCILNTKEAKKTYKEELLKKISYLSGTKLMAQSDGYSYAVDICNGVSKDHPEAAVTRSLITNLKETTIVLGRFNNTDIVGQDDWLIVTFASGDKIKDNSTCNGTEWKAMILLMCNTDTKTQVTKDLEVLEAESNACMAQFQLMTGLLCPEQTMMGPSIFFTLFIIGFFLYFIIGITYRRFVLGAKGYEQVPNYTFWASILALPRELLRKLLRGDGPRHESMDSAHERNIQAAAPDAADEPLLSP